MIPLRIYLRHFWQLWDSEILSVCGSLTVILMLYAVVGSMDYADEQRQEAMRHQQARNATEQAFIRCLNGGWVAQTDKVAVVCQKAFEVLKP